MAESRYWAICSKFESENMSILRSCVLLGFIVTLYGVSGEVAQAVGTVALCFDVSIVLLPAVETLPGDGRIY